MSSLTLPPAFLQSVTTSLPASLLSVTTPLPASQSPISSFSSTTTINLYTYAIRWGLCHPLIGHAMGYVTRGLCTNAPPDFCCVPFPPFITVDYGEFTNLPLNAVAALWKPNAGNIACDGRLAQVSTQQTRDASGMSTSWDKYGGGFSGASYFEIPGDESAGGWIGLLGTFCQGLILPGSTRVKRGGWGSRGGQPKWGYPDVVIVNGTNYTDGRRGDLVYRDENGVVLDLNLL